jgi:hypothetical protein
MDRTQRYLVGIRTHQPPLSASCSFPAEDSGSSASPETETEELRAYLGRLLGWKNISAIDHAPRSIDLAREHRPLVRCRHGDLAPVAYGLHRCALGADTPFIVCDPPWGNSPASVRSSANYADAATAFDAAEGGSLCVRRRRPPHDFPSLVARLRDSRKVQYICRDEDSL